MREIHKTDQTENSPDRKCVCVCKREREKKGLRERERERERKRLTAQTLRAHLAKHMWF